ncbi:MAG TPA: translocation/assembly module TamB domain-containing protein [Solimonas sp.]|nr:translocation/assembly module TamB domain-containing protein [Solimonas sp.]
MNARLKQALWLAWAVARATAWITGALLIGALVFVLFTNAGAQLGLRIAGAVTHDMVVADGVDGTLWGPLKLRHLEIHLAAADIAIDDAELDADFTQLARRRLDVAALHAARVQVALKPGAPEQTPPSDDGAITRLPIAIAVHDAKIGALTITPAGGAPMTISDAALAASWVGDRVVVEHLTATTPWVGRAQIDGLATLRPDAIELHPLHTQGFAVASVEGVFGYGTPSDLHLKWQKIAWPPDAAGDATAFGSGGGEAHWRGLPDDYHFDLDGTVSLPQFVVSLQAEGAGSLSAVTLARLDARALGGELHAHADVSWHDGVRIDGAGRFRNLHPEKINAELPGVLNGSFDANTTIADGRPNVRFAAQLDDSMLRGYPLALNARGQYRGDRLDFETLHLRSGEAVVDARGQVLPTLDAQADIDAPRLADAWPGLLGSLHGKFGARGPLRAPHVTAHARIDGLSYDGMRLRHAQLSADVDPKGRLDVDLDLRDADAGVAIPKATLAIHGTAADHDIALDLDSAQGDVALAAHGALDIERPSWRGELRSGRLAPAALAAWTLEQPAAIAVDGSRVAFDPMCWSAAAARACIGLKNENGRRRADFALSDFALTYLQPLLPGGAKADVVLQASGHASFGPRGIEELRADIATGDGHWQVGGLPPIELKPAKLSIDDNGADGTKLELRLPLATGLVSADATLAPGAVFKDRRLGGELTVDLPDLAWLRLLTPEISSAKGHANGRLQLGGTLIDPQFEGHVELADGELAMVTPGITLGAVGLRVDSDAAGDLKLDGEAHSDKGSVHLSGTISPRADPLKLDLRLRGENFQAMKTAEAKIWVSPDLHVALADRRLAVDGTVAVPKASITPKSLGDGSVSASSDEVMVGDDPGAQVRRNLLINADVTLKLGDDVRFEGFGLKSRLTGSVQALEQPGVATRARGEINLVEGHYKAYGQDLTIETGKLIFSGGPVTEPALEVRATRKPTEEVTVGLYVRGTLRKPDFQLFSTPPMPQQQQLAWLVLGRPLQDNASAGDKSMVGDAATSLGLAGGEWLAQQLGSKIGIDEISVGAKPGESNDQAMFTVGKYLSPKLFISYGIGLFQQGYTFRMQYDLGHGFKARTETGVESGGDLLYTFERK